MGLQHSRQSPAQAQHLQFSPAPQAPGAALLAPGSLSAPSAATLQALLRAAQGIDRVNSADPRQKGGMAAQQPTKGGHGSALEPRLTVDWCQPPVIDVQYEPDLELGQGAGSRELHTQQMLRASQVDPCPEVGTDPPVAWPSQGLIAGRASRKDRVHQIVPGEVVS